MAATTDPRPRRPLLTRRLPTTRARDPFELVLLIAFVLLSLWVLTWTLGRALSRNEIWTGIDGLHASDPALYFGFIASAAHSGLVADIFDTAPLHAVYLHPGFLISGLITHLGLSTWQSYLLWKPVAVIALFVSVRAYVHRLVPGTGGRRAALLLGLLFVPTAAFLASIAGAGAATNLYLFGIEVDIWPGTWLWGYSFTLLAVAAMPAALWFYERDRRRSRSGWLAPALALLCSWLQPWQGATLLGTVIVSEGIALLIERRAGPAALQEDPGSVPPAPAPLAVRVRLPALTILAGALPLVYYSALERLDSSWKLSGAINQFGGFPVWTIAASIAPLAIPALLVYRTRPASWQDIAVRVWPLSGLAVYWAIALGGVGTFPPHAFQGLTIPLAILAVLGTQSVIGAWTRPRTLVMATIVALLVVPALVWKMRDAEQSTQSNNDSLLVGPPETYYLQRGEADALDYLRRDSRPGAVLAAAGLGEVTPGRTGRQTWVGVPSYTPSYAQRRSTTEALFNGMISPSAAVAYVHSARVRFLVADCEHHGDLIRLIAPLVANVAHFGCATVITLR
jgi:hypothetical protein